MEHAVHHTLWLILETLGSLFVSGLVLRFWLIAAGTGLRDPIGHFVRAVTEWLVRPLRSIVPPHPRFEWASLLAALLATVLLAAAYVLLLGQRTPSFGLVVLLGLAWLIRWSLWLLIFLLIVQAVLSWVNPAAPIAPLINQLTEPLLAPIRRRLPLVGGVDLSPLVLILLAQLAVTLLRSYAPLI
jgi:YggT family protein